MEFFAEALRSHLDNLNGHKSILPILIVGAGPVGLILAILLTKFGIKCAVIEKNKSFTQHPQAHFLNNRSMEVFRKLDGLVEEINNLQPPVNLWKKYIYCTSLSASNILGQVDHMQPRDLEHLNSPVFCAHLSQYKLTKLLLKKLEILNFNVCNGDKSEGNFENDNEVAVVERQILMGHECVSMDCTDDCVNVTTSYLNKLGQHTKRTIQCGILVGADGGRSTIRKLSGIEVRGERNIHKFVTIHFISRELGDYLLKSTPAMLYFVYNTKVTVLLVAHNLMEGEFVVQVPFFPPLQKLEDFTFEMCARLIFKLVGKELGDVKVVGVKPWAMHAEIAENFVSCDNRIILVGDSAHRFPPAGGFGMNTGIQDAHNLAWKLASVVKSISPRSILQTYEIERRPIAILNTVLSVQNYHITMDVLSLLGLDITAAKSVQNFFNPGIGSKLPSRVQRWILDAILALSRAQLSTWVLNNKNPIGSKRLAKLRCFFEEGRSLQLFFPAEDLGFRYLEGALVSEKGIFSEKLEKSTGRRREYVPCTDPGSRLPHRNIKEISKLSSEGMFSTLDLVSGNKLEFLLIIAPMEESYCLAHSAFKVADEFKVSAKVCVIWPSNSVYGMGVGSKEALMPWKNYVDVVEVKHASSSSSWWDICQMTDKGAILVRPDEHIAWRIKSKLVGDPTLEMKGAFSTILGHRGI